MSDTFIRCYAKIDSAEIKSRLLIWGDLSGQCAQCQAMNIAFGTPKCPQCGNGFGYIAFRNIKTHLPKVQKIFDEYPYLKIVDFDDYARNVSASRAKDFFK